MVIQGIIETRVDERFAKSVLGEFTLLVDVTNGFFNATKLCKMMNEKRKTFFCCSRSKIYIELVEHLRLYLGTDFVSYQASDLEKSSPFSGTYVHPLLFLYVASWCSSTFYVKSCFIVNDFFSRSLDRQKMFSGRSLFENAKSSLAQDNVVAETGVRIVKYAGFEMTIDRNNSFNATKLCSKFGKNLFNFTRNDDFKSLYDYLLSVNVKDVSLVDESRKGTGNARFTDPAQGTYFHPILFLRLAMWLSLEFYVKVSQIVILSMQNRDQELKLLSIAESESCSTNYVLDLDDFDTRLAQPSSSDTVQSAENDERKTSNDGLEEELATHTSTLVESENHSDSQTENDLCIAERSVASPDGVDNGKASSDVSRSDPPSPLEDSSNEKSEVTCSKRRAVEELESARKRICLLLNEKDSEIQSVKLDYESKLEKLLMERDEVKSELRALETTMSSRVNELTSRLDEANARIGERDSALSQIKSALVSDISPKTTCAPLSEVGQEILDVTPLRCFYNAFFIFMCSSTFAQRRIVSFRSLHSRVDAETAFVESVGICNEKKKSRKCLQIKADIIKDLSRHTSYGNEVSASLIQHYENSSSDRSSTNAASDLVIDELPADDTFNFPVVPSEASNLQLVPNVPIGSTIVAENFEQICQSLRTSANMYLRYSAPELGLNGSFYCLVLFTFHIVRAQVNSYRRLMVRFYRKLPRLFVEVPPSSVVNCDDSSPYRFLRDEIRTANSIRYYNSVRAKMCPPLLKKRRGAGRRLKVEQEDTPHTFPRLVDTSGRKYVYVSSHNCLTLCLDLTSDDTGSEYGFSNPTLEDVFALRKEKMRVENFDECDLRDCVICDDLGDGTSYDWTTYEDPNILTLKLVRRIIDCHNPALRLASVVDEMRK